MTPSLKGRLHTRLILFLLIGIPVTVAYAFLLGGVVFDTNILAMLMTVLVTVLAIGLILDPFYILLQRLRWDRDWPFAYQLFFSWVEFGLALLAVNGGLVPISVQVEPDLLTVMVTHFALVFVPSFLFLLGPLQVMSLRWRYNAGEFGDLQ